MQKYTNEQYNEIFYKLPDEIKDVISSAETTAHMYKIGQKHDLHVDKIGDMIDLTFDAIMGIIATKNFVKELQDSLEISALDASVLARDIDENIFKPIKKTMTDLYAGGAPYKPSSSLVQFYEEDDEHKTLNKADILKEIEDPSDAPVRVEVKVHNPPQPSLILSEGEMPRTPSLEGDAKKVVSKEIIEYHEELVNADTSHTTFPKQIIPVTPKAPSTDVPVTAKTEIGSETQKSSQLQAPSSKLNPNDFLNKITSLKLSNAFVMPKGGNAINELKDVEVPAVRYDALANSGVRVNDISLHPVIKEVGSKFASLSGGEEVKQPIAKLVSLSGGKENSEVPNKLTTSPTNNLNSSNLTKSAVADTRESAQTNQLSPEPAPKIDPYRERI